MPTLRFGNVWQVIRHFGVVFLCNLGTFKTVISTFITTRQILLPHILPHVNMTTPTMFPVDKKLEHEKNRVVNRFFTPPFAGIGKLPALAGRYFGISFRYYCACHCLPILWFSLDST
jgi:hypothetical protein